MTKTVSRSEQGITETFGQTFSRFQARDDQREQQKKIFLAAG